VGKVHWSKFEGAFVVETELGAILRVCPNSDEDIGAGIHVDEITVPEDYQRRGAARQAMAALCRLADEHKLVLKGGPIGWSDDPRSQRFVAWLSRLGFEPDPSPPTQVDDQTAFYARRLPQPFDKPVRRL
jgi:GNAT superfamily N-acetyltransferase